jgi:hypothetical protein
MDNPIPHGPDNLYCPLTLSAPLGASKMSKVCHTCPLWMHIRGKNPNTGADVDRWSCGLAQLPILMVENAQQSRFVEGAVNELRKEQTAQHDEMKKYAGAGVHATRTLKEALIASAPPQVLLESKS